MVTQYDEKGKIFTQVVSKQPIRVVIQTIQNIISGAVHVRPDARVKDELCSQDRFLAITEAIVYNQQNEELYRANFLVLNVNHIIWVIPEEEITKQ